MLSTPFPFQKRSRYFGFKLPKKTRAAPQVEDNNITFFVDEQRKVNLYLRALMANDFVTRPTSSAGSGARIGGRPYIEESMLYFPDACAEHNGITGADFYRAAAIHCAAHMAYMQKPLEAKYRSPFEIALISMIEDARVEALAIRRYPGLKTLWKKFHTATPEQSETAGDYLNRLARALIDETYEDPDSWIILGRRLFAEAQDRIDSNKISQEIGLALAQAFIPKHIKFRPRHAVQTAYYRDDNYSFWDFREVKSRWRLVFSYDTPDQVVKADNDMSGEVVQQVLDFSIAATNWHARKPPPTPSCIRNGTTRQSRNDRPG